MEPRAMGLGSQHRIVGLHGPGPGFRYLAARATRDAREYVSVSRPSSHENTLLTYRQELVQRHVRWRSTPSRGLLRGEGKAYLYWPCSADQTKLKA